MYFSVRLLGYSYRDVPGSEAGLLAGLYAKPRRSWNHIAKALVFIGVRARVKSQNP